MSQLRRSGWITLAVFALLLIASALIVWAAPAYGQTPPFLSPEAELAWRIDRIEVVPDPPSVTVTEPTPTPSAGTGMGSGAVEQWRGLVAAYGGWDVDRMLCLMRYESGGNPNALNPTSGAAGLLQVMPLWWNHYGGDRFDPATNVRVAHLIWQQQGYRAWSPYKAGRCR